MKDNGTELLVEIGVYRTARSINSCNPSIKLL